MVKIAQYILLMLLALLPGAVLANTESTTHATAADSLQLEAYLVTCSPGTELYEVYGHTALRLCWAGWSDSDVVANYGVFSFKEDNFLLRWLLGETDYSAELLPYPIFCNFYQGQGRTITEQRLNLTQHELRRLAASVVKDTEDAHFVGWTYRYNFFYDNCTTRVLDAIEQALDDSAHIEWSQPEEQTLREMLHQFAQPASPWMSEGQDFLIGTEVDRPATMRQQLFSPIWASNYVSRATIVRANGSRTPLALGAAAELPEQDAKNPLNLPFCIAGLLLIAAAIFQRFKGWWWHAHLVVHILQGVVGTLVAFLFLCSTHPAVDSNWLLSTFNPLWFIAAWYVWRHRGHITGRAGWCYIGSIIVMLILALIGKIAGQSYPLTAILLHIYLLLSLPQHDETK